MKAYWPRVSQRINSADDNQKVMTKLFGAIRGQLRIFSFTFIERGKKESAWRKLSKITGLVEILYLLLKSRVVLLLSVRGRYLKKGLYSFE